MLSVDEALEAYPSEERIRALIWDATHDPPTANTTILGGYGALSGALGRLLHADQEPENATFATFAAWTARTLRLEVRPGEASERRLARRLYDEISGALLSEPGIIARNIACGQAAIFQETGAAMQALFDETLKATNTMFTRKRPAKAGSADWDATWTAVTRRLGDTAAGLAGATQRLLTKADTPLLQDALIPYFKVIQAGLSGIPTENPQQDPRIDAKRKERAELILLGNLRLVAYEQQRLQPVLARNLGYLPQALRLKLVTRWTARPTVVSSAATRAYMRVVPVIDLFDRAYEIAATRFVYSMRIGEEDLPFGVDLPLPPPAHPVFRESQAPADQARYAKGDFLPYQLQVITDPGLWAEWEKHDRSRGQGAHTSVDNWLRLPERMNFIANVFRSRQQLSTLYEMSGVHHARPVTPSPQSDKS